MRWRRGRRRSVPGDGGRTFFFDLGASKNDVNFERKFKDQDGIVFDISEKSWLGTTR